MSIKKILAKTDEYLHVPAVVRFEQPFIRHLAADFNGEAYVVEKHDRFLVVYRKGSKSPKILTAHIDRHGIVTNQDGNFEYAAFNAEKHYGISNDSSEEEFTESGESLLNEQVYAYNLNGNVLDEGRVKSFSYDFDRKNLMFEMDGLKSLPNGTPIALKSPLVVQDGNISSQIDNALSVAVAYQLIQDGFDGRVIFTPEEEIGRSWQHIVSYLSSFETPPKEIITLDTTPYDTTGALQEGLIVLRNKDEHGIFNSDLVDSLRATCDREGIRYEFKDEFIEAQNARLPEGSKPKKLGRTELGRIVKHTNGRYNGATIQLPTINYHTNRETTSELALQNYYQTLLKLLNI